MLTCVSYGCLVLAFAFVGDLMLVDYVYSLIMLFWNVV